MEDTNLVLLVLRKSMNTFKFPRSKLLTTFYNIKERNPRGNVELKSLHTVQVKIKEMMSQCLLDNFNTKSPESDQEADIYIAKELSLKNEPSIVWEKSKQFCFNRSNLMLFEVLKIMENDDRYKKEKMFKMVWSLEKMLLSHICIIVTKLDHTSNVYGFNLQCTHCNEKIISFDENNLQELPVLNKPSEFLKFLVLSLNNTI